GGGRGRGGGVGEGEGGAGAGAGGAGGVGALVLTLLPATAPPAPASPLPALSKTPRPPGLARASAWACAAAAPLTALTAKPSACLRAASGRVPCAPPGFWTRARQPTSTITANRVSTNTDRIGLLRSFVIGHLSLAIRQLRRSCGLTSTNDQ